MDIKQDGSVDFVAEENESALCDEARRDAEETDGGDLTQSENREPSGENIEYGELMDTMSDKTAKDGEEISAEEYSNRIRELEELNEALMRELEEIKEKELSKEDIMAKLSEQERDIKEDYPEFVLGDEMGSPLFSCLAEYMVRSGEMTLKKVYEMSHFEETLERSILQAAKEKEEKILNGLKARWQRPSENGLQRAIAESPKRVSDMTRKERALIAERAANGDIIKF